MLKIGVIGYGLQASTIAKMIGNYDVPYCLSAICDPRIAEIKAENDRFLKNTSFYLEVDQLLAEEKLDGLIIGTTCNLHSEMACKAARLNIPVFLEKPVAINFEQIKKLHANYKLSSGKIMVSLPMRLCPLMKTVKEIIDSGVIGSVEQIVAHNDVGYGEIYFTTWYRDYSKTGDLFLQKAVHDFDYISYLIGSKPKWIAAMKARRIFGGNKPFSLCCRDCNEQKECPESPYNMFRERGRAENVRQLEQVRNNQRMCIFSEGIKHQDMGECLIEYENGAQSSYTQNFFVRNKAHRRGGRIYGYKGTIEYDFKGLINVFNHRSSRVDRIEMSPPGSHYGGDTELVYDFLMLMTEGKMPRTSLKTGIWGTLTALYAIQSSTNNIFCEVILPE